MVLGRDRPAGGLRWSEMSWRPNPISPILTCHIICSLTSELLTLWYYALWLLLCIMIQVPLWYICHSDIHTIHSDNLILCIMIYLPCILLYWYTMHYDIYVIRYDRLCIRVAYTCGHTCTLLLIILCLIGSYCILNKYSHTMPFRWNIFLIYVLFFL